eukprot:364871-Chlamydomonas_euryale.AAC.4
MGAREHTRMRAREHSCMRVHAAKVGWAREQACSLAYSRWEQTGAQTCVQMFTAACLVGGKDTDLACALDVCVCPSGPAGPAAMVVLGDGPAWALRLIL